MPDQDLSVIPLIAAHELRWDFREVIAVAAPVPGARFAPPSPEDDSLPIEVLWSRDVPDGSHDAIRKVVKSAETSRGVAMIAASAAREVATELPASDGLGVNLRRLLDGAVLRAFDHAFVCAHDRRRPCLGWIGQWSETAALLATLARLANETLPVLIRGETGTGKEMIARGLHVLGHRRERHYLPINCAELPDSVLESELFGHARGAFTGATHDRPGLFEAAADGTVFLDEIGELPLSAQAKLLRLLESYRVRRIGSSESRPLACRIVAATNRDLLRDVRDGRFRADLFYRLRGSEVLLRPLRERRGDIIPLAESFVRRAALRFRRASAELTGDARVALLSHRWPGNIRELRQLIDVAVLYTPCGRVDSVRLGIVAGEEGPPSKPEPLLTARAVERAHILRALTSTAGNKMAAARILGLTRQSLQRRLIRHGIAALRPAEPGRD
jgi:transcriptional regulator with GAF, ATPase, and Fis domain